MASSLRKIIRLTTAEFRGSDLFCAGLQRMRLKTGVTLETTELAVAVVVLILHKRWVRTSNKRPSLHTM